MAQSAGSDDGHWSNSISAGASGRSLANIASKRSPHRAAVPFGWNERSPASVLLRKRQMPIAEKSFQTGGLVASVSMLTETTAPLGHALTQHTGNSLILCGRAKTQIARISAEELVAANPGQCNCDGLSCNLRYEIGGNSRRVSEWLPHASTTLPISVTASGLRIVSAWTVLK